ncbi:hypothetical protein PVAND_005924 [Polypedilum vanderplanki]|uniref:Uncharacterized protein n=1 Tax=Polypedilum vanderplanki TaxID=319348 RepID=A0A9J6C3H0_POLVA|nr:hypothetical protein PVAND_005924 [Polypedilum vanderplanki]
MEYKKFCNSCRIYTCIYWFAYAANNLIVGTVRPDAVLLFQQTYNQTGIPGQIVNNTYSFSNPFRNITLFRAYDFALNNTGGFASILYGGVGYRNVTYNFRASAVGRGYVFVLDIYGV